MQFSEHFRRWLKSAALTKSCVAPDRGDAVVALPVAVRRSMTAYDYNNSRDFPVARHWSGPISDDSSDV